MLSSGINPVQPVEMYELAASSLYPEVRKMSVLKTLESFTKLHGIGP
jgi:hypothetical protein